MCTWFQGIPVIAVGFLPLEPQGGERYTIDSHNSRLAARIARNARLCAVVATTHPYRTKMRTRCRNSKRNHNEQ